MNLDPGSVKRATLSPVLRIASVRHDHAHAIRALADKMGTDDLDLVVLLVTPQADSDHLIAEASRCFTGATVVGCTTAGEISQRGYAEGEIVAIGFPSTHFHTQTTLLPNLSDYDAQALIDRMIQSRHDLRLTHPARPHEFNFMLIDGLSTLEDKLTSDLAVGLGPVPLFGGSAGDGDTFGETFVLHQGRAYTNAAVLVQVRTDCPVKVFKTDHFLPTDRRMVVTGADPARRIVHEINAEPAAREYARILGKDPEQLTPFTFAAHPVVVRIGGQHHVRSIQQINDSGDLQFFSAIDEGLVLTLAEARDMVEHLDAELSALADPMPPSVILGCDCFLRRLEAQENQVTGALSALLRTHRVVGFSTYGEQFNSMHVNQTLTGVAIYPPEGAE
ncbi:FIST N-terminal domain-containing protein [Alisedimentitalea sp. MJ-SS2]|uniref:FIST N-terminal domain-containing protein n=1 Tax=Aliisedimentitalea sp. MJ-SS2 TaxID=3049795 RepID=UPI00291002B3|nr:FIST N-terminal domain-containing protein [Alisedimentitalea sp. MJ-SS2]MDU8925865.1 FIST N-terminal domain-containing protein [Alisedimentitalea sp. MJ-SS2]